MKWMGMMPVLGAGRLRERAGRLPAVPAGAPAALLARAAVRGLARLGCQPLHRGALRTGEPPLAALHRPQGALTNSCSLPCMPALRLAHHPCVSAACSVQHAQVFFACLGACTTPWPSSAAQGAS